MSLTISLRIPDAIVLAADSLMLLPTQPVPQEEFIRCPHCESKIPQARLLPPPKIPLPVSKYARKLFCLESKDIGIASFGTLLLNNRSIESHLLEFERNITTGQSVEEITYELKDYFLARLPEENLSQLRQDEYIVGLQVAGYDEDDTTIGKTYFVKIGKETIVEPIHVKGYGCTFAGDGRVIQKLWKEDPTIPIPMPNFQFLSIQDAIDYVVFLITTTIQFQRFAPMLQTCGGAIDVAIITPYEGFQWISRKSLSVTFSKEE